MLFYILTLLLDAKITTIFQSNEGLFLFEADKPVRKITSVPRLHGDEIWALVDGDANGGQPDGSLMYQNIRIVMGSSPKTWRDRHWLTEQNNPGGMYFIRTWTDEELLFVG
jgi:hypothetical protein